MGTIMELKNVNKIYGTQIQTQVLYDISLNFEAGSFNSIIGQSGSGKSTLLNIMGTLDRPTTGNVLIKGVNVNEMTDNELADIRNILIGFVFQFHYLLPEFTAIENVLMPYRIRNQKVTKEVRSKAEEYMELVGLSQVRNNPSSKMSGGQQQRTAIARALINNPSLILADEPTGNLDSDSTENIYELMRDINQKLGTTFIIITHDRRIAEKADRIVEIKDGRINLDLTK
ncbi:MAG: ABC transporter ATP-binding protein [Lachnospiraceae bacterium]|nr:ABC transporter ATP-binding protein [Lachnospiraceae bacterium]